MVAIWCSMSYASCKYSFPLKSFNFWIFNDFFLFYIGGHFENSKTWMHLLRWGSVFLWSLVKIGSSVSENLVGQIHLRKRRKNNNNNNNYNCNCKAIADVTPPHYFGTSVSMVTSFWILSTQQKLPHTTVNIPTMFHEVWWKI